MVDGVKKLSPQYSEIACVTIEEWSPTFGDFGYEKNANGTGIVITEYLGNSAEVVIPDTIDELPITEIGDEAFFNNTTLRKITVPQTVERIGVRAFKGCTMLSEMD